MHGLTPTRFAPKPMYATVSDSTAKGLSRLSAAARASLLPCSDRDSSPLTVTPGSLPNVLPHVGQVLLSQVAYPHSVQTCPPFTHSFPRVLSHHRTRGEHHRYTRQTLVRYWHRHHGRRHLRLQRHTRNRDGRHRGTRRITRPQTSNLRLTPKPTWSQSHPPPGRFEQLLAVAVALDRSSDGVAGFSISGQQAGRV